MMFFSAYMGAPPTVTGPAAKLWPTAPRPNTAATAATRMKPERLVFIFVSRIPRIGCIARYGGRGWRVFPGSEYGGHVRVSQILSNDIAEKSATFRHNHLFGADRNGCANVSIKLASQSKHPPLCGQRVR